MVFDQFDTEHGSPTAIAQSDLRMRFEQTDRLRDQRKTGPIRTPLAQMGAGAERRPQGEISKSLN
jgi:hypothetical protein